MRVCLFTDTLGDVNGVSRFVRAMAEQAELAGCELMAACSTRFEVPARGNLVNFRPRMAGRMPGYGDLEIAWPPGRAMVEWARRMRPDAVHVSTPGPVGLVGRRAARVLGVPLVGVYHTDFPAYVGHLFEDAVCERAAAGYMRWFYGRFSRVLTRTREYEGAVGVLGIARGRIVTLRAGIDAEMFHPRHRRAEMWAGLGVPEGVKVLYVGRVSVEKGLPVLARAWKLFESSFNRGSEKPTPCAESSFKHGSEKPTPCPLPQGGGEEGEPANERDSVLVQKEHGPAEEPLARGTEPLTRGTRPSLVIVGDGPYRTEMERELAGCGAHFLGFRHGAELSALYASADLFAFPSATDTLGQVVMEAQASGLPALVTDRGGPRGIVGEGGMVLPAENAGVWAAALGRMIGDAAMRERMGGIAHRGMRERSMGACFEHFWALHREAAGV